VSISEGCFIFDFAFLPLEVARHKSGRKTSIIIIIILILFITFTKSRNSPYKSGHSTKMTSVWAESGVMVSTDNGKPVLLDLLNVPAAFDVVDHNI